MRPGGRPRHAVALVGALLLALGLTTIAEGEIAQRGHLRVRFQGTLRPAVLPRTGVAPVRVAVGARITATNGGEPPQLRGIAIAINRHGRFTPAGLPICHLEEIQPASTGDALAACRSSLVGQGTFTARVLFPAQAPFPSVGRVFVFNSVLHGRPTMLAHVYGTKPAPISYTLPFSVRRSGGTYGTVLSASLPPVTADWGYVTGLSLNLGRRFMVGGRRRSYFSAGCPAPPGFRGATFPFARATFSFAGGVTLTNAITRSCRAQG